MKYVAVTLKGIEDLASAEVKSLLKSTSVKIGDGRLLFDAKSLEKFSPTLVNRLYLYIAHFDFSSGQDIIVKCSKVKFSLKGSFVVRCSREGIHDFDSRIIERDVGGVIYNQGFKVNLENPDNTVVVDIVGKKCFLGILVRDNICKRPYRIKVFSSSINACLAAAAVKLAAVKKSDSILDPFCRDGVIAIEASASGCENVFACDESMNNIRNAKINAKLALTKIKFAKCNIDSLDLRFDEGSIDKIMTFPPFLSKRKKQSSIESLYKEFFHQARNTLKKSGFLILISHKPELLELHAKRAGFKMLKEKNVFVSNLDYKVMVFKKT